MNDLEILRLLGSKKKTVACEVVYAAVSIRMRGHELISVRINQRLQ